uniref:Uncharacterized protein n=1 Tax=Oryza punctata TaxID=4537 RepID=A0A0E0LV37_ORYPU
MRPRFLVTESGKRVQDPAMWKKMSGGRCDREGEDGVADSLRSLDHHRSPAQSPQSAYRH